MKGENIDFTSEENCEVTKLLEQMIDNIKELTKETVLARGKVVSIANKRDSQNWDADMFSNLSGVFYSSAIYQEFVEQIYNGIDPLDSEEFTQELKTISKTFTK